MYPPTYLFTYNLSTYLTGTKLLHKSVEELVCLRPDLNSTPSSTYCIWDEVELPKSVGLKKKNNPVVVEAVVAAD